MRSDTKSHSKVTQKSLKNTMPKPKKRKKGRSQRRKHPLRKPRRVLTPLKKPDIGDGRVFRFKPDIEPLRTDGRRVEYILSAPKKPTLRRDRTKDRIAFRNPKKVYVCKRRRERRRSLFSSGKIGKGRVVSKVRVRNANSDIKC